MTKLFYLLSLLSLVSAPVCLAQDGVYYGYCSDDINGHGFDASGKYYIAGAFRMTESDVAQFDGCEITGVSIGFGSGRNKNIEIFMTEDLSKEAFFTQAGRVRASSWSDIPITEPVKIQKDKPFYIGYTYYVDNMTAQPIGTDNNTSSFTDGADWMSAAVEEEGLGAAWKQYGPQVGNICIRAIIKGNGMSTSNCVPMTLTMPELATPGEPFDFKLTFTNATMEPVKDIDIVYQLGTDPEQAFHCEFPTPVGANERGEAVIRAVTSQDELEIPSWARIDKVNGQVNDMAAKKIFNTLVCTTGLFERKVVVEKFTGMYCGYCPRGIVGFDYMNEHYAGSFIGIAVQNYSYSDEMYCTAYNPWTTKFAAGGAPYCYVNRNKNLTNNPEKGSLENAYNMTHTMSSNIGIKVTAEPTSYSNAYDATATVKVARDVDDADYSIAFVVTEDFVGPYRQANNYNTSPGCPEFSGKGAYVSMLFNDVARNISSEWEGIANSVPTSLKAGEEYPFTVKSLSLGATSNPKNANIIALLIDNRTSEIVNADRLHLDPTRVDEPVSIDRAEALSSFAVTGGKGVISVEGGEGYCQVYTVTGQLTAVMHANESVHVAPGIYLVRTPQSTHKVMVR